MLYTLAFGLLWIVWIGLAAAPGARAASTTATYTATETLPVPPASSFAGSGGGDGWAVAMTPTAVYNVFHHSPSLTVACHLQSDASACWSPETITDGSGNGFATNGQPGLWLNQSTGKLYVYATRSNDGTAGVVCIDTTQAASNPNPFCGFTALTAVGDAPLSGGISGVSTSQLIGSRLYSFNFVNTATPTGTQDKLMCFDTSTLAPCASQPFSVAIGSGAISATPYPPPAVAAIGSQLIVPITVGGNQELACYNAATGGNCAGSWPVALSTSYVSSNGAPYPLLDSSGNLTGLCLPTGTDPCFTLGAVPVPPPANMTSVVTATSGWDGPAVTIGPRVYIPDGNTEQVDCYDYSKSAACAGFPHQLSNLGLLYSVNPDPQRPTCIWVNSDDGTAQIQNFDAFTGGPCGQGAIRVLASSIVAPGSACTPASYTSLQVISPPRSAYSSGSVTFEDPDGNQIPNTPSAALDGTGTINLQNLNLNTSLGLPQFVLGLNGLQNTQSSVTVRLTWTGQYNPSCIKAGTSVTQPPQSGSADLGVTQGVSPNHALTHKQVSFSFTVTNHGPNAATSSVLVDTLPAGLTLKSAHSSQGTCSGTRTVTCKLGTLASGATVHITFVVLGSRSGSWTNSARVSSAVSDPKSSNNTAKATVRISAPALCRTRPRFSTGYDMDDHIRQVIMWINGHRVRTLRGRHLGRAVRFSRLATNKRFTLKVDFILFGGNEVFLTRRYNNCSAGRTNVVLSTPLDVDKIRRVEMTSRLL